MSIDYNSTDIDSASVCRLAFETLELASASEFVNNELCVRTATYFLEAIELDSKNTHAYIGLSILLMGGNLYEEAVKYLESAMEISASKEINEYIELAIKGKSKFEEMRTNQAKTVKSKTITDLLAMSDKMNKYKK